MIYVCPEKDAQVYNPCVHCTCGMDKLPEFAPNPLARLVGELPGLKKRYAAVTGKTYAEMCDGMAYRVATVDIQIASPSAHAIAIEAIERLERYAKALRNLMEAAERKEAAFDEDNEDVPVDELEDAAAEFVIAMNEARAALAAEPDKQT